jgi:hypothetical protein
MSHPCANPISYNQIILSKLILEMKMKQLETNIKSGQFHSGLKFGIGVPLVLAALIGTTEAVACAACGCTLSKDWETQGISSTQGFTVDVSYDYLNQDKQRYGKGAASDALVNSQYAAGQEVEAYTKTQTITATLIYNSDVWGVSFLVPYVSRSHGTYGADPAAFPVVGSDLSTSSDSGIGDIRVVGRYTGFSEDKSTGLIAGVKLPTGNTSATFNGGTAAGAPLDAGLQIGTGSTDLILGGSYTGAVSNSYGWFVQGTVQHAIATKSLNGADYRPGDAVTINTGIRYAAFGAKVSPILQLNIIKRQADTDNNTGVNVPLDPVTGVPVSGGTLAYISPGVLVRVGGGMSAYGFVQLPIYQDVNSLQIAPSYTLTLGVRQSF